jgi:hypothetical protein
MDEIILAEEEAVINRGVGFVQEVESGLDLGGETEGNLVLTNLRLVYVHGGEKEVDLPVGTLSKKKLYISDVDELDSIRGDPSNITIHISSITSVKGHRRPGSAPKLEVRWNEGVQKSTEFVEQETGASRRRNLNDWAPVIERLRAGTQKITMLLPPPDRDSLEGRILLDLDDMQEKGLMTIEGDVEKKFGLALDPDEVKSACEKLASQGLIKRTNPSEEGPFYVKISALGDDDLNQ